MFQKKITSIIVFTFCNLLLSIPCYSQLLINDIDYSRIPQRKVRCLLHQKYLEGNKHFNELSASCFEVQDSSNYSYQKSSHIIKETILKVWSKLKSIRPRDEFSGRIISLGFLYSKKQDKIFYNNDDRREIEEGELVFLNLKLLGGIKNIGVAFEVTKVDDVNKIIQLCYLSNGLTEGTQEIKLTGSNDGNTVITQETRYRNKSKFREKRLYPLFHRKAVNEMHANLKNIIEGYQ